MAARPRPLTGATHERQHPATHRRPRQVQRHPAVHEGQRQLPDVRLLGPRHPDPQGLRRGPQGRGHGERAGRPGDPPGHQGIQQLAHHPAAVREGRIHRRLRHHDGDVRIRRTAAGARRPDTGLSDARQAVFGCLASSRLRAAFSCPRTGAAPWAWLSDNCYRLTGFFHLWSPACCVLEWLRALSLQRTRSAP
ncbi:hypothetical protein Aave_3666 [Paracidovorax citrulli AAC00-1]|uniref:Uncharacterized protein n=1 Tax=Paracidovorax citrulli (strain AAC00-1) TaxID=397945 RepID=A1TTC6_PARC0|nr:hypothetical protein Aave_3666 [Paracidovorax citrulli AAC00-1]